jgi:hypothetical protein
MLQTSKMIAAGVLTLTFLGAVPYAVLAEEEVPTADASVAFLSKYVWRGFELSDGSMVIQPSITTAYKGFSGNLWGNFDTDYEPAGGQKWNETDFTLSYDGSYEKFGYGGGWIYYALDGTDDTQEFYGTVSYDVLLAPTLTIYYDTDHFAGAWYANLAFSHTFMIAEKYGLDLGLSFGYLDDNEDYNALHNGLLSASMSFPINKYFAITPELYWSFPLSNDAEDYITAASISNDDQFIYGGVSASFSF